MAVNSHGVALSDQLSVWNANHHMLRNAALRFVNDLPAGTKKDHLALELHCQTEHFNGVLRPRAYYTSLQPLMSEQVQLYGAVAGEYEKQFELLKTDTESLLVNVTLLLTADLLPKLNADLLEDRIEELEDALGEGSLDAVTSIRDFLQSQLLEYENRPEFRKVRQVSYDAAYNQLLKLKPSERIPYPDMQGDADKRQHYIDNTATSLRLKHPSKWSSHEECVLAVIRALAGMEILVKSASLKTFPSPVHESPPSPPSFPVSEAVPTRFAPS